MTPTAQRTAPRDPACPASSGLARPPSSTQLLNHAEGLRFAVVENEFGAVNIDSQLISRNSGGVIELSNGCVCCTISADLVRDVAGSRQLDARPAN
jgi:G3E family GTPase